MKYIKSIFITILAVSLTACFEEELLTDGVSEGASIEVDGDAAFLFGETDAVNFNFTFLESSNAQIQEIAISKQLVTANGTSEEVNITPVTEEGGFSISKADLFADVPVGGTVLTESDLAPGDRWVFSFTVVMTDGRELSPLGAAEWNVTFTCPSDLAGTYNAVATGFEGDGDGGQAGSYSISSVVTLSEVSSGIYSIDDMSFGLYPQVYEVAAPSGRIQEVCGQITDLGDTDQYGDPFTITGTSNGDGTIELEWGNTWGDTGTITLTRQE